MFPWESADGSDSRFVPMLILRKFLFPKLPRLALDEWQSELKVPPAKKGEREFCYGKRSEPKIFALGRPVVLGADLVVNVLSLRGEMLRLAIAGGYNGQGKAGISSESIQSLQNTKELAC